MNKSAEDDFRELELYLQQAQEEIGQVLSVEPQGTADLEVSNKPSILENEGHGTGEHCLDDESDLDDILRLYDNMEFYSSENRKSGSFDSDVMETTVDTEAAQNVDNDIYKSGNDKATNKDLVSCTKLESEKIINKQEKTKHSSFPASNMSSTTLSDNSSKIQDMPACVNIGQGKANCFPGGETGDTHFSRSLTCDIVKNVSIGSLDLKVAESKNHMAELSNCKSPDATCCLSGKVAPEVSAHLQNDGSPHSGQYRSADILLENLPVKSANMQIDDRNGGSNLSEDKSKLVNLQVGFKMGDCTATEMQCEKFGCDRADDAHSVISEFLEEINESLDELISGSESGISDDSNSVKSANSSLQCNNVNVTKIEIKSENDLFTDKIDGTETAGENGVKFTGEDVVETDSGYYWLTCSINETSKTETKIADCDKNVKDSNDESKKIAASILLKTVTKNDPADRKTEHDLNDKSNRVKKIDGLEEDLVNAGKKKGSSPSDKKTIAETDDDANIKDHLLESHIRNSYHLEQSIQSVEDSETIPSVMTMSVPNFLSLDRAVLREHKIKKDCYHSMSDEHLQNTPKRKYSAPPSFCKVYKVVSVDIPKMDITLKSDITIKYGNASKACSGSDINVLNAGKKIRNKTCGKVSKKSDRKSATNSLNEAVHNEVRHLERISPASEASFCSFDETFTNSNEGISSDLNTSFEPPEMFQDKPAEVKKSTEVQTGPILEPPPAFASNTNETMEMSVTPPTVWDPGVSTNYPHGVVGQHTLDRNLKHPTTPPPPSVDRTEKLISSTLNQHKYRKFSADANSGLALLNMPEVPRRKSADSGVRKSETDLNGNNSIINFDLNSFRMSCSAKVDINSVNVTTENGEKTINDKKFTGEKSDGKKLESKTCTKSGDDTGEAVDTLDLLSSYHEGRNEGALNNETSAILNVKEKVCHKTNFATIATNTTDSLRRNIVKSKDKNNTNTDTNTDVYATVNKKSLNKNTSRKTESIKQLSDIKPSPPPIPKRTDSLKEATAPTVPKRSSCQNIINDKTLQHEHSPELQVMFNSLSPVLLRRRPSNKRSNRPKDEASVEASPEVMPNITPVVSKGNNTVPDKVTPTTELNAAPSESLFMDPEMARTWHGATSSNWTQFYGPQLRAMMKELNQLTNGDAETSHVSLNRSDDDLERGYQTLPSKSLLDEMHKKLCADQYWNSKEREVSRDLVLLRLKSQPPVKPKRSQSFNIRMGTGTSNSSTSSECSPLLPRVSERVRIKTRPDVQYSPKLSKIRAVTPENRSTDSKLQTQSSKKEDAEIEAIEACRWLRETGFPQYAQLYEDGSFPVDVESVEKDHDFLDKEDIQSLFRRLNTLNKCAIMKIGTPTKKEETAPVAMFPVCGSPAGKQTQTSCDYSEDSDEEDQCALSDKWKYQRSSRRWSRKDLDSQMIENKNGQAVLKSASSHDSLLTDQNSSSETGDSPVLDCKMHHMNDDMVFQKTMMPLDANGNGISPKVIRRGASEKLKSAKSFLKRMESLKGSKRGRKPKTITEISGPVIMNSADMQEKIRHLNCKEIGGSVSNRKEPVLSQTGEDSKLNGLNISENSSLITSPRTEVLTVSPPKSESLRVTSPRGEVVGVTSPEKLDILNVSNSASTPDQFDNSVDISLISTNGALNLDLSSLSRQSNSSENTNSSEETLFSPVEYRPGRFPKSLDDSLFSSDINVRTRSFSYIDESSSNESKKSRRGSHDPRHQMHRISIYDNVPIEEDLTTAQQELDIILSELFQNINGLNKAINGDDAELLAPPVSSQFDDSNISIDDSQTPENEPNTDTQSDITHEHEEHEIISGTLSSPDISDHELHTEEISHDDSAEHIVCRERRDSGVGSSLTRTNSDRRKYRIRWHSFQKSHRPTSESRTLQLCNLSAGQILVLKKLSLLKLTALVEKYSPNRSGWSLTVPRFMKRHKAPDYKDKNVFQVPFSVMIQRTGQALPQCILHAMRFLRRTADDALGIFRKSGVRSRIQKLRNEIEANPEMIDFQELQAYDVADLVKQYFRELPECLLTNKLSDIFISIFIYVPTDSHLEALQAAVVLMADENRDVLQSLLLFLSDIAKHHNKHQMTASNLAVCFAPSLFNMGGAARNTSMTPSPRRNRKNPGIPDARELMEQKAAHECLTVMIQECKKLFTIPAGTLSKCRVWHGDPVMLHQLNSGASDGNQGYTSYIDSCIQGLLKEAREKFRGWVTVATPGDIDVSYKKVGDGHPLRLWKCAVDVEAPPNEVLNRVINDRQLWDEDLLQWMTVEKLDKQTEVFQYVRNSMAPHPTRDYCVLRSWRTDLPKGACVLISTSIEHPDAELMGGIQGVELASRYLIEPCGTGKSRLTHISRVDLRGHSPDWYKKVYGHICANFMDKIRTSFQCSSDGPETKV